MDKEKKKIGQFATIVLKCSHIKGLAIIVEILDVKFSYGTFRYKVTPKAGMGETWVQKLTVIKPLKQY